MNDRAIGGLLLFAGVIALVLLCCLLVCVCRSCINPPNSQHVNQSKYPVHYIIPAQMGGDEGFV